MNNQQHSSVETTHNGTNNFVIQPNRTRVRITATAPVNIFSVDDGGQKEKVLAAQVTIFDKKIYYCEEIMVEADPETYYTFLEIRPNPLDTTPVEVPAPKPVQQLSLLKQQIMNEMLYEQQFKENMTFAEFIDLNMSDELPDLFEGTGLTPAQMQAEVIRQHKNPMRGMDLNDYDKGNRPSEQPSQQENPQPSEETPA
jgi:hypothetical protein